MHCVGPKNKKIVYFLFHCLKVSNSVWPICHRGLQPGQLDRGHEQMGVWYQNLQGELIRRRGTKMGVLNKTENRKENADL